MLYLGKLNSFIENKYTVSNWKKKKFVWRYSFFFSIFYILLVLGIVYTLTIRLLVSSERFNNYSCSSSKIQSVERTYMIVLIFIIIMGFINFIFSRLTYLYSNYTNSEFFNLGFYYKIVGFLIKYTPWILSLIYMAWFLFLIISIITIFVDPKKWCSLKYNMYGTDALNNCLLVKNGETGCEITNDVVILRKKESCNDFNVLKVQNFIFLVRSSSNLSCSLKDKKLCDFFVDFIRGKETSWKGFPNCSGNTVDTRDAYFLKDLEHKSDFYLFSVSIVIFWTVTTIVLFTLFIVIKVNTPIDSSFIMNEEKLNLFFKFSRLLDVWR